ncbi:MAG: leucine--tRNA ligase [Chlamydia sp.]
MQQYHHKNVEKKWQQFWVSNKTFKVEIDHSKPKYYVLDMFPYPSGAGLHVGHVLGYTATDIIARFKRMVGFNVLHPMGWDSFGLPAEQYAIRTGTHPKETTKLNIDTFREQLKSLGFSYDWDREIATSDATYYKWTQWIFSKLYEKGLAYEAELPVNFCPALGTVLANEEVDDGRAKEGGHIVIRMPLRQWVLKITEYADRLLEDLDLVDWPESVKLLQKNWIGRSEGCTIHFPLQKEKSEEILVFTTRHDTLFGVSYLAIAPEHPIVWKLVTPERELEVKRYLALAAQKSEIERAELHRVKSGVFSGAFCVNPTTKELIPIWIADYVLATYGTGAVMGVPGHDERDNEFAHLYNLPIPHVICPSTREIEEIKTGECIQEEGILINSSSDVISLDGMSSSMAKERIAEWLEKKNLGKKTVQYKLRDWLFSRQRYWGEPIPVLHFEDGSKRILGLDELPLCPPELTDFRPTGDGKSPLSRVQKWVEIVDEKDGRRAIRETNTMPQWAGSCWYYLRFIDPLNQDEAWSCEKERYWLPVDMYIGGVEHAVLHLLYARFWHKVLYDLDLVSTKEPFQSLRNQGLLVSRSYKNSSNIYIDPQDVEEEKGLYLHKKTGEILASQVEKMSKSKLNGINPDDIIQTYGADSIRLYEMFMGPLEKEKIWNSDAVVACRRFLVRAFEMVQSEKISSNEDAESMKIAHRLVDKAIQDYNSLQFNTIIAKMMEFINEMTKRATYPKKGLEWFVLVLSPIAPHIAEEMWQMLGHSSSLAYETFPQPDKEMLEDAVVTYVIQVNGKLRGRVDLAKDRSQEEAIDQALSLPNVQKFLQGEPFSKIIFVPNKIINFVV